jgi:hypothetical protein
MSFVQSNQGDKISGGAGVNSESMITDGRKPSELVSIQQQYPLRGPVMGQYLYMQGGLNQTQDMQS